MQTSIYNRLLASGLIALLMAAALPLPQSALSLCLSVDHFSLEVLAADAQDCGEMGGETHAAVPADSDECCHHERDGHGHDDGTMHSPDDWCLDLHLHGTQDVICTLKADSSGDEETATKATTAASAIVHFATDAGPVTVLCPSSPPRLHDAIVQLRTVRLLC
jgi:hypothetical protein